MASRFTSSSALACAAVFVGLGLSAFGCSSEPASGGTGGTSGDGAGAGTSAGNTTGSGGATGAGAGTGTGSGGTPIVDVEPGYYAIDPPNQCKNQYYVEGCEEGNPASACGGVCTSANACQNEGKPGDPGFACPRFLLFSDEFGQAQKDDALRYTWGAGGESPFNYAVVGHDTDTDPDGVDDAGKTPCCQCYQLVFDQPEQQMLENGSGAPTVPAPKPLVVQAFNTGATTKTFDIYLGAGGLGAWNGCAAGLPGPTGAIDYQYSAYPPGGQPNGGGVKAVGEFGNGTACKNEQNLVTAATVDSAGCQSLIEEQCNTITADSTTITDSSRRSCIDSNLSASLYHANWTVYAKRVACPQAITEVTGCKLVEDLPPPDPNVLTAAQAAVDGSFKSGYSTTTMQDCCKPSCSWQDKVTGTEGNHVAEGLYNSFYTCDKAGVPLTEP